MRLQTFVSKALGRIRDAENDKQRISDIPVVAWVDDELVDVTGIRLVRYHSGGPLFAEIDTEPHRENLHTQNGYQSGTRQSAYLG